METMWSPDVEPHYTLGMMLRNCGVFFGTIFTIIFVMDYFDDPYRRAMAVSGDDDVIIL
jgi:hypothetical protein